MPEIGPEIPRVEELVGEMVGEEEHKADRYGRRIAVAIVLTTLIGALVAFAQAGALRTHDESDARAENLGALALESSAVDRGQAEVQINRFNLLTEQVRQADNASLFDQYGAGSQATRLTAARWNAIASQTESDTASIAALAGVPFICSPSLQRHCPRSNAFYSPEQDPRFPTRYLQGSQFDSDQLTALRDAANEEADDAEAQFVHYATALTMLAVAVFLFGYSLTPQGRLRRRLYSRVATVFVAIAGVWGLFQVLSPLSTPPKAAASAYANGETSLNIGDYQAAITYFAQAIKLRPRFVDAYYGRAQAEYAGGVPHTGSGLTTLPTTAGPVTIPSVAALNAAVKDGEQGRSEGGVSPTDLYDLGRDLLYRGLLERRASDLETSRSDLQRAASQLRDQPNSAYLVIGSELQIAEADLALGSVNAAAAYKTAEAGLLRPEVPREQAVAAALTDLSLISTTRPALASRAATIADQLVAVGETGVPTAADRKPAPTGAPVHISSISPQPDPGHALYEITRPGNYNPLRDVLSAQWEYKDPLHGEWAVLPEISGPVVPGGLLAAGNGYTSNNVSYVSDSFPATCLPQGHYRIQLFVNGQLAAQASTNAAWPALHAVHFSDVDAAMCVPATYQPLPNSKPGQDGYFAPNGSGGALILSIPKAAAGSLSSSQSELVSLMDDVVSGFSSSGLLKGLQSPPKPQSTPFFMSSPNGQMQTWSYNNGQLISGVGVTGGQIYVGLAFGPSSSLVTQAMFLSLSPL
jgi:tetratricopeptide (TPR) repeat protein